MTIKNNSSLQQESILDSKDQALWELVTKSITPLKKASGNKQNKNLPSPSLQVPLLWSPSLPSSSPRSSYALKEPGPFDPHTLRQIRKHTWKVDHTLDLHGHSEKEAYQALSQFLEEARTLKLRKLKVITGRGQGILRARVPQWILSSPVPISQLHPLQTHRGVVGFYLTLKKE